MKILIADDHALFREGMCHVLGELAELISAIPGVEWRCAPSESIWFDCVVGLRGAQTDRVYFQH